MSVSFLMPLLALSIRQICTLEALVKLAPFDSIILPLRFLGPLTARANIGGDRSIRVPNQ